MPKAGKSLHKRASRKFTRLRRGACEFSRHHPNLLQQIGWRGTTPHIIYARGKSHPRPKHPRTVVPLKCQLLLLRVQSRSSSDGISYFNLKSGGSISNYSATFLTGVSIYRHAVRLGCAV